MKNSKFFLFSILLNLSLAYSIDSSTYKDSLINSEQIQKLEKYLIDSLINSVENKDFNTILEILKKCPYLINEANDFGETVILTAILFEQFDIIKKIFENEEILIKPDLLIDKNFEGFGKNNPVEYAKKLSEPSADPDRKTYREIAKYLENEQYKKIQIRNQETWKREYINRFIKF